MQGAVGVRMYVCAGLCMCITLLFCVKAQKLNIHTRATDSPLPQIDLKYYVLPLSQRQSSAVAFKEFKGSPVGKPLVFVRAIAIALTVATKEDEALVTTCCVCTGN